MSKKFLTPIDLTGLELLNFRVQNLGSAPGSPGEGQTYYNSTSKVIQYWNGTSWVSLSAGTTDHGALTGLGDDDHTQYLTSARHSAEDHDALNIDADTLDGIDSTAFLRSNTTDAFTSGTLSFSGGTTFDASAASSVLVPTPTTDGQAANKGYVDGVAQGLDIKASVKAVATSNIASLSGTTTIDGVSLVANDRVLLTAQTTVANNGIWLVQAGAWTRPSDYDGGGDVSEGAFTFVEEGTANEASGWVLQELAGSFGSYTTQTWTQFSGAGQIVAGDGLTKSGNTLNVGAGTGITVAADTVSADPEYIADTVGAMVSGNTETGITVTYQDADNTIDFAVAYGSVTALDGSSANGVANTASRSDHKHSLTGYPKVYSTTIGNGSATAIAVTHNLGTRAVEVQVFRTGTPYDEVEVDIERNTTNQVTITFASAPASGEFTAVVVG